jgi:hypothetical protein
MKRKHRFAENDGYADTLTGRRSNFVGEEDLPADYGRVVGVITSEYCNPSKQEFDVLDKAPVWWKTPTEWRGLANKYEDASRTSTEELLSLRNLLKTKADLVDIWLVDLNKIVKYPSTLFTKSQWEKFAEIFIRQGFDLPARICSENAKATTLLMPIISNINPPDMWEVEYAYLQSLPDGQMTKADLQAASKRFLDAGYAKYAGGLNAKAMYFDVNSDVPRPSWWTDLTANPDYKAPVITPQNLASTTPATAFAPEINVPFAYPKADIPITDTPQFAQNVPFAYAKADVVITEALPSPIANIPSLDSLLNAAKQKAASMPKKKWWKILLRIKETGQ